VVDIENEEYMIKLTRWERLPPYDDRKFTFSVHHKLTQQDSIIEMENMTTEIGEIKIVKDRLVIFGDVSNAAWGVTILDLKRHKEIDFIICYRPQLSETKRYLIYEKFYPRFSPEEASDLILIYDLEQSPEDNRVEEKYKNIREKSKRVGDPGYLIASENVGYPIYPEENIAKQTYFVWVPSPEERHFILTRGKYLWLDQDNKILFVDGYGGENWLVLVDLSKGLSKMTIKKKIIDVASVLTLDPKTPDYETLLKEEKERFAVSELRPRKDGRIDIHLSRERKYRVTAMTIDLPSE